MLFVGELTVNDRMKKDVKLKVDSNHLLKVGGSVTYTQIFVSHSILEEILGEKSITILYYVSGFQN